MSDPLFLRAQRAIEENRAAREERRLLLIEQDKAIYDLRWAIHESAFVRAESKARRDNRK